MKRRVYKGHTASVNAVAVTDDLLISGSSDKTLCVWNLENGQCQKILMGHTDGVTSVALLPGNRCISGSKDRTMRVWDLETGVCRYVMEGHRGQVNALSITAKGKWVISGSSDCCLKLWELDTGNLIRTFEGHPAYFNRDGINSLIRSSNSEFAYHDFNYNLAHGVTYDNQNNRFFGHADAVTAIASDGNGKIIVSGSSDNTLRLWDPATEKCRWIFGGHEGGPGFTVRALAITKNRRFIVSGGSSVEIWRITGKKIRRLLWGIKAEKPRYIWPPLENAVQAFALAPRTNRIAVASAWKPGLGLFSLFSGKGLKSFENITCIINDLAFSPTGNSVVAAGSDGTVIRLDLC